MGNGGNLTHLDTDGNARIVDVGHKSVTRRRAIARSRLEAEVETISAILGGKLKKGDALAVARIAGIMAAKRTADLIPLCHPLALTSVTVDIVPTPERDALIITAAAETTDRTGVEMEALTAASVAALTLYDMAKSMDRAMRIAAVELVQKSGGKSGDFRREPE